MWGKNHLPRACPAGSPIPASASVRAGGGVAAYAPSGQASRSWSHVRLSCLSLKGKWIHAVYKLPEA